MASFPRPVAHAEEVSGSVCGACALAAAAEADKRLREELACSSKDIAILAEAANALDVCVAGAADGGAKSKDEVRWRFPVAGVEPAESIGGRGKNRYENVRPKECYVARGSGHAAHDLFVDDRDGTGHDRHGNPFEAVAVDEGVVMVTRDGWTPDDGSKGGNFVMLYLPRLRAVAYYAHLEKVLVRRGDRVERGATLGHIGRTGVNAMKKRSQTHLHFALWDATSFRPMDAYRRLARAEGG